MHAQGRDNNAPLFPITRWYPNEQNDEWAIIMRRYLTIGSLEDLVQKPNEEPRGQGAGDDRLYDDDAVAPTPP